MWRSSSAAVPGSLAKGAREHADKLAKKYLDEDVYPYHQPGDVPVLIRIQPERVFVYGA